MDIAYQVLAPNMHIIRNKTLTYKSAPSEFRRPDLPGDRQVGRE